jgi:addiction module HigA family antidote
MRASAVPGSLSPVSGASAPRPRTRRMDLSQNALARALRVPPRRINEIVLGKRSVSADTDLRLARYFGVSEGLFLGLQADFDLMRKRRQIHAILDAIEPRAA